jgi:uncharacterized protein (DUF697 family)
MTTAKEEAMQWVHRYAIGSAVFAALPLPFSSAGLIAIQTRMLTTIDEVYGEKAGGSAMNLVQKGALALLGRALKRASVRATEAVPRAVKPLVRMAIAGATTEALGFGLILLHERKRGNAIVSS